MPPAPGGVVCWPPPSTPGTSELPVAGSGGSGSSGSVETPRPAEAAPVSETAPAGVDPKGVTQPVEAPVGRQDGQTQVNAPASAQEPLPAGMVRNQYGEIVFTDPTPAQQATEIEVRNLNIDKQLGTGVSPAYHADYTKPMSEVRADDISTLQGKGPEFWDSIQDPAQKLYLEQLRDSPNPGVQIDKSMGPTFLPVGPGTDLNKQLGGLVKGGGAPVSPTAPTVNLPSPGTPTQTLPRTGPGQTQVLPPD